MFNAIQVGRALVAAAALLPLAAAYAQTTYRSQLSWGPTSDGGPGTTGQDVTTTTGGAYALSGTGYSMSTSGSPLNNGTAEAQFSSDFGAVAVSTQIQYLTQLAGPAGGLVPVHVIAYGFAEGNGYDPCCGTYPYSALAHFTMDSNEQGSLVDALASPILGEASQSFNFDQIVYIMPNTSVDVRLAAGASTTASYNHTNVTGHAFVDPQFIIDPAYASRYAFVGLPTAVPEPASGVLLALGGGLIAVASRRRRQPSGETPINQRCAHSTKTA